MLMAGVERGLDGDRFWGLRRFAGEELRFQFQFHSLRQRSRIGCGCCFLRAVAAVLNIPAELGSLFALSASQNLGNL